jgi:hypothetical protein
MYCLAPLPDRNRRHSSLILLPKIDGTSRRLLFRPSRWVISAWQAQRNGSRHDQRLPRRGGPDDDPRLDKHGNNAFTLLRILKGDDPPPRKQAPVTVDRPRMALVGGTIQDQVQAKNASKSNGKARVIGHDEVATV